MFVDLIFLLRCGGPAQRYERGEEPPGHSLQLVAIKHNLCRWHVRVILEYGFGNAFGLPARKEALMVLCKAIDFSSLPLLDDTVTEVYITTCPNSSSTRLAHPPLPSGHPFAECKQFWAWAHTREDPTRYRYPSYTGIDADHIEMSKVCPADQVGLAVHTARIGTEGEQILILKQIERLLYIPEDSLALGKELYVLEKIGGQYNTVRLIAAITSRNPYATDPKRKRPAYYEDSSSTIPAEPLPRPLSRERLMLPGTDGAHSSTLRLRLFTNMTLPTWKSSPLIWYSTRPGTWLLLTLVGAVV